MILLSFKTVFKLNVEFYVEKKFEKDLTNKINAKYFSYDYERLSSKIQELQIFISKTVVNQEYLRNQRYEINVRDWIQKSI
jgi:hypothetical protein